MTVEVAFRDVLYLKKNNCHRLNRAFDYETKEMLRLKNKGSSVIVVYDDDETIANK